MKLFLATVGKAPAVERDIVPSLPGGLRDGECDVYVSVGRGDGTPVIALPLAGGSGERRYLLGTVSVGGRGEPSRVKGE